MADARRARGMTGEDAAAALLTSCGYELVARNFRTQYGELDIVAIDHDCLVFCEVRSRVGRPPAGLARAKESVGPAKRMQLRKMAREWFGTGPPHAPTAHSRFDVVAVCLTVTGSVLALEHVVDAF